MSLPPAVLPVADSIPRFHYVDLNSGKWWEGQQGVIDMTRWVRLQSASAGDLLKSVHGWLKVLTWPPTRFKIGVCDDVFTRWIECLTSEEGFTHMFHFWDTDTAEGACYFESALIALNWNTRGCVHREVSDKGRRWSPK